MAKMFGEAMKEDENLQKEFSVLMRKMAEDQMKQVVAFAKEHGLGIDEEHMAEKAVDLWKKGVISEYLTQWAEKQV